MMEYAVALSSAQLRSTPAGAFSAFDRIYAGSEFCQNLLPDPAALASACKRLARPFTLLLPPVTDEFLPRAAALSGALTSAGYVDEIVVNDPGLAGLLSVKVPRQKARLSAGRVLTVMMGHSAFSGIFFTVFGGRLEAIEADSPDRLRMAQGGASAPVNFHAPLAYLSVTRYCHFKKGFNGPCKVPCGEKLRPVAYRGRPGGFYIRGNACLRDNREELKRGGGIDGLLAAFPAVKRLVLAAPGGAGFSRLMGVTDRRKLLEEAFGALQ